MLARMKSPLLILALLLLTSTAHAEIYRWVDEQGKVHFGDKKPNTHQAEEVNVKINTYTSVSYEGPAFDYGEKKVVMYSAEWCGYCKKAKNYFNKKGIAFTEYDIEKNPTAKKRYKKMGATGVPVITVGKKRMNGFSVEGFEKMYN